MAGREEKYIPFKITLRRSIDGFVVSTDSEYGQTEHPFNPPLSAEESRAFETSRRVSATRVLSATTSLEESSVVGETLSPERIGERLLHSLLADDYSLAKFLQASDDARKGGTFVRLYISFDNAGEFEQLPWEFLHHRIFGHLALSPRTPFVRFLPSPFPIVAVAVKKALNVLVVTAHPDDLAPIDARAEWRAIAGALEPHIERRQVAIDWLDHPSIESLEEKLGEREYHVVHFVGHGDIDQRVGETYLCLEDSLHRSVAVTANRFARTVGDHPTVKFVFLAACKGAMAGSTAISVAQALVAQGIPAVLGMNNAISVSAAGLLTQKFYGRIAKGEPVDLATVHARKALAQEQDLLLEWGTPVLYMRSRDGRLFKIRTPWWRRALRGVPKAAIRVMIGFLAVIALGLGTSVLFSDYTMRLLNPLFAPPAPQVTLSPSHTDIFVDWSDSPLSEASLHVDKYLLTRRSDDSHRTASLPGNTTVFQDTGLAPGTEYRYSIQAVSGRWVSEPGQGNAKTEELTTPTSLTAISSTPSSITLAWEFKQNGESGVIITGSCAGTVCRVDTVDVSRSSYTVGELRPNTGYTFGIKSYLGQFESSPSGLLSCTTSSLVPAIPDPTAESQRLSPVSILPMFTFMVEITPKESSRLSIDDKYWDVGTEVSVSQGQHEIRIENPNFPIYSFRYDVESNDPLPVSLEEIYKGCEEVRVQIGGNGLKSLKLKANGFPRPMAPPGPNIVLNLCRGTWHLEFLRPDTPSASSDVDSIILFPYGPDRRISFQGNKVELDLNGELRDYRQVTMLIK